MGRLGDRVPRRVTSGLDAARIGMVLAVLQRRADVKLGKQDVYAATVGGVRLAEPSVDLAIALAVASSAAEPPLPQDVVVVGEVGLAGEVRQVTGVPRRSPRRSGWASATRSFPPARPAASTSGSAVEVTEVSRRARGASRPPSAG